MDEIRINSALRDRRIIIDGEIDDNLSSEVCYYMNKIYDDDIKYGCKNKKITLLINSYGGSIWAGNAIIGTIDFLKGKGYKIIGIVQSVAFSMAFDILCNCDERYGYSHSEYMMHQSQIGTKGSLIKAETLIKYYKKQWEKCYIYYMKNTKITLEQIKDVYENDKELWMLAEEALEMGVIQKILK